MNESVTVHMNASPEQIWELVSDVTKIGRYSPETFEAEWLDGATGPAAGARFRGHVAQRCGAYLLDAVHRPHERAGARICVRRGQERQAAERVGLSARASG